MLDFHLWIIFPNLYLRWWPSAAAVAQCVYGPLVPLQKTDVFEVSESDFNSCNVPADAKLVTWNQQLRWGQGFLVHSCEWCTKYFISKSGCGDGWKVLINFYVPDGK